MQTNSQKQEIYRKRNQLAIRRLEQIAGITLKEIHRQIVKEEKIMKCPTCNGKMYKDYHVWVCDNCEHIWNIIK